jgi:hypothetical protein
VADDLARMKASALRRANDAGMPGLGEAYPPTGAALRKLIDRALADELGGGRVTSTGILGSFRLSGARIAGRAPLEEIRFQASFGGLALYDQRSHETMVFLQNHTSRSGAINLRGALAALLRGAKESYPGTDPLDRALEDAVRGLPGLKVTRMKSGGSETAYLQVDRGGGRRTYGLAINPARWTIDYWPTSDVSRVRRVPIEGASILAAVHHAAREMARLPV